MSTATVPETIRNLLVRVRCGEAVQVRLGSGPVSSQRPNSSEPIAPDGKWLPLSEVGTTTDDLAYLAVGCNYSSNRDQVLRTLRQAFDSKSESQLTASIHDFVASEDGEFLVIAEQLSSGRCLIFNDFLGRLPLYQAVNSSTDDLVLGRSVVELAKAIGNTCPDRLGLAARLLFCYPLDERTEFSAVSSVAESSIFFRNSQMDRVRHSRRAVDYGGDDGVELKISRKPITSQIVSDLGEALVQACVRRANALPDLLPTVSLSGGLDSRLVACGLRAALVEFEAITRQDYLAEALDANVACQIARLLSARHHKFSCGQINFPLISKLTQTADGVLSTDSAHMLGFLLQAQATLGTERFMLTGDGGDKTVAPLLPLGTIKSRREVERLFANPTAEERQAVLSWLGLSDKELREYCLTSFEGQPGLTAAQKTRAIAFRQRARRWLAVAEDRNRSVYWSTSPFYSPTFFKLTNQLPDRCKQRDRLYWKLLAYLNHQAASIPRPGQRRFIGLRQLLLEIYMQLDRMPSLTAFYRRLKAPKQSKQADTGFLDWIVQAGDHSGLLSEFGDRSAKELVCAMPTDRLRNRLIPLLLRDLQS
ncbi:MAG: hypothetical protein KF752_20230 [Pirellulaceae bacterium]|nr:hypothetical protein [Pirellulaceae bacterium]